MRQGGVIGNTPHFPCNESLIAKLYDSRISLRKSHQKQPPVLEVSSSGAVYFSSINSDKAGL